MTVTFATAPTGQYLTSYARVQEELSSDASWQSVIERMIREASVRIYSYLGRPLFRSQFTETRRGNRAVEIPLARYPLVSVEVVSYAGSAQTLSDFTISDRDAGLLARSTASSDIDSLLEFTDNGSPIAWSFTYTAGYFLVGDDFAGSISVAASDKSYNSAAAAFHPLLRPGDWFVAAGFTDSANNGMRQVVTATTSKITVSDTLVDEGAASRTLTLENVDTVYERACIDMVKRTFLSRKRDGGLKAETVGPIRFEWDHSALASMRSDLMPYRSAW